jgi:hypothetical protein
MRTGFLITGPATCARPRGTQSAIAAPAPAATKARRVDIGLSPASDRMASAIDIKFGGCGKAAARRTHTKSMLHRVTLLGPDKLL